MLYEKIRASNLLVDTIFRHFLGAVTAEAAPRPLTDLGYFHWANQSVTPAENTFVMHYGENTKIEPIEGDVYSDYLTVGRSAASLSKAVVKT